MSTEIRPIICTKCKTLALAYFDDRPLCPHCLTASVTGSKDPFAVGRIRPLASVPIGLKGIVKCRQNSKIEMPAETKIVGTPSYTL